MSFFFSNEEIVKHFRWVEYALGTINRNIGKVMSSFEDLVAAQAATDAKIAAVKADVEALIAKLAAVPAAGMTAEQQAALDAAVAHASAINDSLSAVDAEVNPPAPPAPAPAA
jgi:ABC-type transporter Mla subunit MlaD